MKFTRPKDSMLLKTVRGVIEITPNEYFFIESAKSAKPLIINKEGIQKIEDFFGGQFIEPVVSQVWNTPTNYNVVATAGLEINGQVFYGVACANTLNLTNAISQAYPIEMAVKRAKATVALEVLRKNYIGDERLPLLYSSMDEFESEASINKNVEVKDEKPTSGKQIIEKKEEKVENKSNKAAESKVQKETSTEKETVKETQKETQKETPVEKTEKKETAKETKSEEKPVKKDPVDETPADNKSDKKSEGNDIKKEESDDETVDNVGDFVIKTYRYRDGITIRELFEKDKKYFKWLAENDKTQGQYVKYQKLVRQFAKENNIDISTLVAN